jgi:hypothetical protein
MTKKGPRRRHRRAPFQGEAELFLDGRALGRRAICEVSEGGIRLKGVPAPIGSALKMWVTLPPDVEGQAACHLLSGQVMWRTLGSAGIQLVAPPLEVQTHLREYVDRTLAAVAPA